MSTCCCNEQFKNFVRSMLWKLTLLNMPLNSWLSKYLSNLLNRVLVQPTAILELSQHANIIILV